MKKPAKHFVSQASYYSLQLGDLPFFRELGSGRIIVFILFPQGQIADQGRDDARSQGDGGDFQRGVGIGHGAEIIRGMGGKIISGKGKYVQHKGELKAAADHVAGEPMQLGYF